jgi:hypothetical protein
VIEPERSADRHTRIEQALSRRRPARQARTQTARGRPFTVAALAVLLGLFVVSLGACIVTDADTAQRIIGRALPQVTEEDALFALHFPDLKAQAAGAGNTSIPLSWFPVMVSVPQSLVRGGTSQAVERSVNQAAARAVYRRGELAFSVAGHGAAASGPFLSSAWTLRQALSVLNARTHTRVQVLAWASGALTLLLAALLFLQISPGVRLLGVGAVGAGTALVVGLGELFAWLAVQFGAGGSGSPLGDAARSMLSDMAWILLLVDAIVLVCSGALVVAGLIARGVANASSAWVVARAQPARGPAMGTDRTALGQRPLDSWPRTRRRVD